MLHRGARHATSWAGAQGRREIARWGGDDGDSGTGRPAPPSVNGILLVYKPVGYTSSTVVTAIKHLLRPPYEQRHAASNCKVGHGGTLDKAASGAVVIGLGNGTKQLSAFLAGQKRYVCRGVLGVATDSGDLDADATFLTRDGAFGDVTREALQQFLETHYAANGGLVLQTPPIFSALKQAGERLSQLVRTGRSSEVQLDRKAREVQVFSIRLIEFEPPFFALEVCSGSGFYVRSLIGDIGTHFGCGATMVQLHRLEQSGMSVEDEAHTIDMQHALEAFRSHTPKVDVESGPRTPTPATEFCASLPPSVHPLLDPTVLAQHRRLECTVDNIRRLIAVPLHLRNVRQRNVAPSS